MTRKTKMLYLTLVFLIHTAHNEELKITDFRPPNYSVYGLKLFGDAYSHFYDDHINYGLSLTPFLCIASDTTKLDCSASIGGGREWSGLSLDINTDISLHHYVFSSSFFVHGRVLYNSYNWRNLDTDTSTWDNRMYGNIELGTGVGHLREGQFTALALYINDLLKKEGVINSNLDDVTILSLAKAIAKKKILLV